MSEPTSTRLMPNASFSDRLGGLQQRSRVGPTQRFREEIICGGAERPLTNLLDRTNGL
jgi:hypothetical protein